MDDREFHPNYVSVICFNFVQPILTLLESLESLHSSSVNQVHASRSLNGFSLSIITLCNFMIESAIARTQYDLEIKPPFKPIEFFKNVFPNSAPVDIIEELFVIRDVIVHNHIWEAKFTWEEAHIMKLDWAELAQGYGDKKLKKVIDSSTRKTKLLGLNLFPTRINRSDAIIVLENTVKILQFLEENGTEKVNISSQCEMFQGRLECFVDIVDSLRQ